jgi:hypothetical protein
MPIEYKSEFVILRFSWYWNYHIIYSIKCKCFFAECTNSVLIDCVLSRKRGDNWGQQEEQEGQEVTERGEDEQGKERNE